MLTIASRASKDITLLLVAVTLFAGCSPPGTLALLRGKKLLEEGQFQLAVEELRGATALLGNTNAQAFNYLGLACHQAGQHSEAERAYQRALALNPDLIEARYNLGCLLLAENRVDQAKAELTAFTLRRGNSIEGWRKLGSAQVRLRDWVGAEKSFGEALRLAPQDPEALAGMGIVRLQHNRSPREAVDFFSRAIKAQPDYSPALLNLAIVAQENLKDRPLALRTYREYLALKSPLPNEEAVRGIVRQLEQELTPPARVAVASNAPAHIVTNSPKPIVTELVRTTAPPKAVVAEAPPQTAGVAKLEPAITSTRTPASTNAARTVPATAPATQASYQVVNVPAEPVFKPAEDVAGPSPPAPLVHAETPAQSASPPGTNAPTTKTAKRSFFQKINPINLFSGESKTTSQAPATSPRNATQAGPRATDDGTITTSYPNSIGRYSYRPPTPLEAGNRPEAERAFAQGVRAQQAQSLTEAITAYRQATELDPSFFDAQYNLGLAAFQQGRLRMALGAYENALTIVPESEEARYNFALALKQANYSVDAANELEKVLSVYPNDARAHLALGNLYSQQLEQPAKARQHYRKVLEIDPRNPQAPAVRDWLTTNPR